LLRDLLDINYKLPPPKTDPWSCGLLRQPRFSCAKKVLRNILSPAGLEEVEAKQRRKALIVWLICLLVFGVCCGVILYKTLQGETPWAAAVSWNAWLTAPRVRAHTAMSDPRVCMARTCWFAGRKTAGSFMNVSVEMWKMPNMVSGHPLSHARHATTRPPRLSRP
jgi:hypothetical protein